MSKRDTKRPKVDFLELLAGKVYNHFTWKQWASGRKLDKVPVYRKQVQKAATSLDLIPSSPLYTCVGAYLPPTLVLDDMLNEYIRKDAIFPSPCKPINRLWVKLAVDNTKVYNNKTEGFYLSLLDVEDCQSIKHQTVLTLARVKEDNTELERVVIETDLGELSDHVKRKRITIHQQVFQMDLFVILDWIGLVTEIGIKKPQHAQKHDTACGFCGEVMEVFRGDWWRDPFHRYTITKSTSDYPNALFPNLPLNYHRYCMMHCVTCNLSNSLSDFYNIFPYNSPLRTKFKEIVHKIAPKWAPGDLLEPHHMKKFFHARLQDQVIALLRNFQVVYDIPWPGQQQKVHVTAWQAGTMVFDSHRIYYQFAYTEWPTQHDFNTLESARVALLAVYAGMKWRMKPTMHYSTNEALDFAYRDGTMYHTLNEGAEGEHHEVKELARDCMKNILIAQTGVSSYQHILNQQELMRTLRKLNYAPPEYNLTPIDPDHHPLSSPNITPLLYSPDLG
jgi:hypothetical protein